MDFLILIGVVLAFELFSFITMKFYWPNKIFGILYQVVRVILCCLLFASLSDEEMTVIYAIVFGILEFLIISNLFGQAGCQDDRHIVEDISSIDIAGDTIINIRRRMVGDSAWGNMVSSLGYSLIIAGVLGVGFYFLFAWKALIGGIILLIFSVLRTIGIIQGIIKSSR